MMNSMYRTYPIANATLGQSGRPANPMDWDVPDAWAWLDDAVAMIDGLPGCADVAPAGFLDALSTKPTIEAAYPAVEGLVYPSAEITAEEAGYIQALDQCFAEADAPAPTPAPGPEPYPLPPVVTEAEWLVLADQIRSGPARTGLWRTLTDGTNPIVITQICKLQTGQVREGIVTIEQWRAQGPPASCDELFALIDDFMVEYPISPDPTGTDAQPLTFEAASALRERLLNIEGRINALPEEAQSSATELFARLSWCVNVVEDAIEADSTIKADTASQCIDAVEATLNRVEGGGTAGPAEPAIPTWGWIAGGVGVLTIASLIAFK